MNALILAVLLLLIVALGLRALVLLLGVAVNLLVIVWSGLVVAFNAARIVVLLATKAERAR